MSGPSFHGRLILYLACVGVSSLLFFLKPNTLWVYGTSLFLWGAMGFYHLGQIGWPVARIWRQVRSLPADLLRGLSAQEDAARETAQQHMARWDVLLWGVFGSAYLGLSVLPSTPPEALLELQQQTQQFDGLDIRLSPGALPQAQQAAFLICLGIAYLLGQSFSASFRHLRLSLLVLLPLAAIFCTVIAAAALWTFPPVIPSHLKTLGTGGPGMAGFLAAFHASGFERATPLFARLSDLGLMAGGIGFLLILLPMLRILRFMAYFQQHIAPLGGVVLASAALISIDLFAAGVGTNGTYASLLMVVFSLLSLTSGYARHRFQNPYDA